MAAPRFHQLTLKSVDQDTDDAVRLTFDIPATLAADYAFTPGQYLTLRSEIDGQDTRRSYSICSAIGEDLSVGVKAIEGGLFSNHALTLKPGDSLDVMTPQGRFMAPIGGKHDYLLLAAGSGITPILSIAKSVLEGEPDSTITLAYANRTTDSVMFREEIEDLKDRFITRFLLTHVMDEEAQDIELFNGRLDREKLETLRIRGLIDPARYTAIYICGPQPMIDAASEALLAMDVPQERLKFELFTPSTPLRTAGEAKKARVSKIGAEVEVILDGASRKFALEPGEEMVSAAARAGLEIPYSCNNGMCATCRCKLAVGTAEMAQNFSLEPWETEAGFILACQTRPTSDRIVLDFDAV
ncbi:MAG: 2Fe-2S iron-sulfur cluster-binding protein [Paracoccaceae bacterium]